MDLGRERRQPVAMGAVVAVQEGDVGAGGDRDPGVARRAHAAVVQVQYSQPRVVELAQGGPRAVGRPVVGHDDLEVLEALGKHAADRLEDGSLALIRGDDDAEERMTAAMIFHGGAV